MAKQDLGTKVSKVYDHPTSGKEKEKRYPTATLPSSLFPENITLGKGKGELRFSYNVTGINKNQFGGTKTTEEVTVELREGSIENAENKSK